MEAKTKQKEMPSGHARFGELAWYDPGFATPLIGGAGGIGSWLMLFLTRAGYSTLIFDGDSVDATNLGGQLYGKEHLGLSKAVATTNVCRQFGAEQRIFPQGWLTEEIAKDVVGDIVFSAFDNMKARKLLFETWAARPTRKLFVDGRMLAEASQVFFVLPTQEDAYRAELFDDKEVKDQPCSAKATSHCGANVASLMMTGFTNWVANQKIGFDAREVPFKIETELPLFNFTVKSIANEPTTTTPASS